MSEGTREGKKRADLSFCIFPSFTVPFAPKTLQTEKNSHGIIFRLQIQNFGFFEIIRKYRYRNSGFRIDFDYRNRISEFSNYFRNNFGAKGIWGSQDTQMRGKTAQKVSLSHPFLCAPNASRNQVLRTVLPYASRRSKGKTTNRPRFGHGHCPAPPPTESIIWLLLLLLAWYLFRQSECFSGVASSNRGSDQFPQLRCLCCGLRQAITSEHFRELIWEHPLTQNDYSRKIILK